MHISNVKTADGRSNQSISAGRKSCIKLGLVVRNLIDGLNFIEIERKFTRNTAIQTCLQVCDPVLTQNVLAACVFFADSGNS